MSGNRTYSGGSTSIRASTRRQRRPIKTIIDLTSSEEEDDSPCLLVHRWPVELASNRKRLRELSVTVDAPAKRPSVASLPSATERMAASPNRPMMTPMASDVADALDDGDYISPLADSPTVTLYNRSSSLLHGLMTVCGWGPIDCDNRRRPNSVVGTRLLLLRGRHARRRTLRQPH